jgi:hypothetical protein
MTVSNLPIGSDVSVHLFLHRLTRPTSAPFRAPHPLIAAMWQTVQSSCEAAFYSETDWARLRMEFWFANRAMVSGRPVSGHTWGAIQHGLNEMLLSPAIKRRAGIELKPAVDVDADAAVSMIGRYKQVLKSV